MEIYSAKRQWGSSKKASPRIVGAIFGVLGLGMLAGGGFMYAHQRAFLKRTIAAEGTVVEVKRERDSEDGTTYRSVVQFTVGNQVIRFSDSMSSSPARHAVGDRVSVLYEPGNPRDASIDSFMNRWFAAILLGAMGGVFSLVGAALVVFVRGSAATAPPAESVA